MIIWYELGFMCRVVHLSHCHANELQKFHSMQHLLYIYNKFQLIYTFTTQGGQVNYSETLL